METSCVEEHQSGLEASRSGLRPVQEGPLGTGVPGGLSEGNQSSSCWSLLIHLFSVGLKIKQQHSGWSLQPRGGGGAAAARGDRRGGGGPPLPDPETGHLHKVVM